MAGVRVFWKISPVIWSRSIAIEIPRRTFSAPGRFHLLSYMGKVRV